jgi:hypothetical protein
MKLEYSFEDPGVLFLGSAGKDNFLSPTRIFFLELGFFVRFY